MTELPEHVQRNRAAWDEWAADYVERGAAQLGGGRAELGDLGRARVPASACCPTDLDGLDAIELGCGTGYVSAWLARRGARPVGIDNSEAQLATARARSRRSTGSTSRCSTATPRQVPLPDASFDFAISEYGASIWCDPYKWIPEAARLLRPGGRLVFLVNAPLLMLCVPDEDDVPAGRAAAAARTSACTASSGPTTTRSSSTSPMAS